MDEKVDVVIGLTGHLLADTQQNFQKFGSAVHKCNFETLLAERSTLADAVFRSAGDQLCTKNSGVTITGEKNPAAMLNSLSRACFRTFAMWPKFQVTR